MKGLKADVANIALLSSNKRKMSSDRTAVHVRLSVLIETPFSTGSQEKKAATTSMKRGAL
jgi:hypothetical protein